jgi:hypothetical protein
MKVVACVGIPVNPNDGREWRRSENFVLFGRLQHLPANFYAVRGPVERPGPVSLSKHYGRRIVASTGVPFSLQLCRQDAIDGGSPDTETPCDLDGADTIGLQRHNLHRPPVHMPWACGPRYLPSAFALAIPSHWRSSINSRSTDPLWHRLSVHMVLATRSRACRSRVLGTAVRICEATWPGSAGPGSGKGRCTPTAGSETTRGTLEQPQPRPRTCRARSGSASQHGLGLAKALLRRIEDNKSQNGFSAAYPSFSVSGSPSFRFAGA